MRILITVEDLRIGGAQTFALRLAQALFEAGHHVWLYDMYWQYTEHDLVQRLAPDVKLVQYKPTFDKLDTLLLRTDDWWQRHGYDINLRNKNLCQHLRKVINDNKIEVVSSNTFKCDALLAQVLQSFPHIPLIITMHGDYEQFLTFYRQKQRYVIPAYLRKLARTLARVNGVAYLSEQNLEAVYLNKRVNDPLKLRKIYNGLEGRTSAEAVNYTRPKLGITEDALVFGMVARGVPEKGWKPVIQAYQRLRQHTNRPLNLVLVGASPFLTQLSEEYGTDDSLRFLGFVNNPIDCVRSFDVGILASSLKESLPNSIAEYLFCGKAVISTDVGEIQQMILTDEGQAAGLLIDFPAQGLADPDQLYAAMQRYATEPDLLASHQRLATQAFAKFDMSHCLAAYVGLYQECIQSM
ncbi:glycosyltransferase family 4 protein [Hymenobacter sp. GOD-10R]|uniref:glycosyltransferase family 4 protein n=1 Tax=Hymenobacter sp. GOD-10R TaxID=3093922 RepID=UPI002D79034B|nr:glycosyltransferase family 4 protein [Hymenobacter sp. GOD-10R]WRQ27447.1 glycosyltransferase family 4 protein [Hymenobacter sp. GOD-10R]